MLYLFSPFPENALQCSTALALNYSLEYTRLTPLLTECTEHTVSRVCIWWVCVWWQAGSPELSYSLVFTIELVWLYDWLRHTSRGPTNGHIWLSIQRCTRIENYSKYENICAKCLWFGYVFELNMDQLDQETGFINSQPGMAQFMTGLASVPALPHINESFQTPSSITGGSGPSVGPTVMPVVPRAAAVQHQQLSQHNQHNRLTPALNSCTSGGDIGPLSVSSTSVESPKSGQSSAEFAWMKEKKTTRKQQHSGRLKLMSLMSVSCLDCLSSSLFMFCFGSHKPN